jgi:hypothetical protein
MRLEFFAKLLPFAATLHCKLGAFSEGFELLSEFES